MTRHVVVVDEVTRHVVVVVCGGRCFERSGQRTPLDEEVVAAASASLKEEKVTVTWPPPFLVYCGLTGPV